MKIRKIYEYESIPEEQINKELTRYIIWRYFKGPNSNLPTEMGATFKDLKEAVTELKEFKKMYKGSNAEFFITKNITSVKVLSDDDIELELNTNKYNL